MIKLRQICRENTYLIVSLGMLGAHLALQIILEFTNCKLMLWVNMMSIIWFALMSIFYKKLNRNQCFAATYIEVLAFSLVAVLLYGDTACFSINVVPLIPVICQWDFFSKQVYKTVKKKDQTIVVLITGVVAVYLFEQYVDWAEIYVMKDFPPYYTNMISYFNFLILMLAIILGNVMWLMNINMKSEQLESILERTDYLANHDTLTGLGNRNNLEDFINELDSKKRSYAILMGDVDYFKKFNDTYGHDCGDYILRSFGEGVKTLIHKQDRVFRWGGEEIVIVIPETDEKTASKRAEYIRQTVEEKLFEYENETLHVTVTIGVALSKGRKLDQVIKEADNYLYYGKNNGRNQVVSAKKYYWN